METKIKEVPSKKQRHEGKTKKNKENGKQGKEKNHSVQLGNEGWTEIRIFEFCVIVSDLIWFWIKGTKSMWGKTGRGTTNTWHFCRNKNWTLVPHLAIQSAFSNIQEFLFFLQFQFCLSTVEYLCKGSKRNNICLILILLRLLHGSLTHIIIVHNICFHAKLLSCGRGLNAIASPSTYPCQWVIHSLSYLIYRACEIVFSLSLIWLFLNRNWKGKVLWLNETIQLLKMFEGQAMDIFHRVGIYPAVCG